MDRLIDEIGPISRELEKDNSASFTFVPGEVDSEPGPGVEGIYDGPYYSYYNWPRRFEDDDEQSVEEAYEMLYEIIEEAGPFDGILGFSHGATLAFGFLAQHAKKHPYDLPSSLFQCAIFINSIPPFRMDEGERIEYEGGLQGTVKIPTLHIAGQEDFALQHSKCLYGLCSGTSAKLVLHSRGHEIPRGQKDTAAILAGCRELLQEATFGL